MANVDPVITVGIEMTDPNWPSLCLAISNHATRALACLESDRVDMAIDSLRLAAAVIQLSTSVVHNPNDSIGIVR